MVKRIEVVVFGFLEVGCDVFLCMWDYIDLDSEKRDICLSG